ncbi:MAG: iron-containing alcohol dehydrogenase [Lentisphaeria bacterium]|nr:iron-containing alcohol dehydrogenase [Lentisphaeria bacterium]
MDAKQEEFELRLPSEILFGCGKLSLLPEKLSPYKVLLLVTGRHFADSEPCKKLVESLNASGHEVHSVSGIRGEGPIEDVDKIIAQGRKSHAEAVISIGGGSVMDCGKAAAALIPLEGSCGEYFSGEKTIPGKGLFFAALPTTSGTGAECTGNAVLADETTHVKKSLRHPTMTPDLALADPLLSLSCPPPLTAASGLDAFVQAFECVTSPRSSAYSESLCFRALSLIACNLKKAYEEPENVSARSAMAEASLLTGMAFAGTGLGAVHGLAHPIGSLLHVPHGVACAVLIGPVVKWNLPCCEEKYARMAEVCHFGNSAEAFLDGALHLAESVGVGRNFRSYGLRREHFPFIVKNCRSSSMKSNPRSMSDEEVALLLEGLL